MKEKKNMSKLDIKVDPYSMELYEIAKEKKALAKRERDLKAKRKSEVHMTKWKALSELKRKFEKELKDSGHSYGVTLAKLAQMEEYYEYQNPKNTKQKSSSDDVEWVKEYIRYLCVFCFHAVYKCLSALVCYIILLVFLLFLLCCF